MSHLSLCLLTFRSPCSLTTPGSFLQPSWAATCIITSSPFSRRGVSIRSWCQRSAGFFRWLRWWKDGQVGLQCWVLVEKRRWGQICFRLILCSSSQLCQEPADDSPARPDWLCWWAAFVVDGGTRRPGLLQSVPINDGEINLIKHSQFLKESDL